MYKARLNINQPPSRFARSVVRFARPLTLFAIIGFALATSNAQTPIPSPTLTPSPTPTPTAAAPKSVLPPALMQLRVNYGTRIVDGKEVPAPVALRRFFLLRQSVDLAAFTELAATMPTRESYYKSAGASQNLLDWLERNNCDSIYCRELTEEDVKQVAAFRTAHEAGQRKFGKNFPIKWLTMFLPASLRIGFYEAKERALKTMLARLDVAAEIVTNEKGTAYFFNVAPGKYFVTNIVPFDVGDARVLWNKEITVKPAPKNGISSGGSPVDISKDAINLNAKSNAPAVTSPVTNTAMPAPKGK